MSDDTAGWILAVALIGGAVWYFSKSDDKQVVVIPPVVAEARPIGLVDVGTDSEGGKWTVDAPTVRGPRNARQGWAAITAPKSKLDTKRSRSLYLVDCNTTATKVLSETGYSSTGEVTFDSDYTPEEAKVRYYPPSTNGDMIVSELCRSVYDQPAPAG